MIGFLTESTQNFEETTTVGGFNTNNQQQSFDTIFTEAYNNLLGAGVDVMIDVNGLIKNKSKLQAYKDALLGQLCTECTEMNEKDADQEGKFGTHSALYEQVSDMFDNCVEDFVAESTRVPQLLPIKAIDFPILVKQQLKLATKDIMQTEITKSPLIKKHIEQTYIVDGQDKTKRWKYPQCFFTDEFKEVFAAGKGLPIKNTPVALPAFNYNIVTNLVEGGANVKEGFTMDLKITKAIVKHVQTEASEGVTEVAEELEVVFNPAMRINLSDNTWLGGRIQKTIKGTTAAGTDVDVEVDDLVTGMVDFTSNTVSLNAVNGQVVKVVFEGHCSNERNERHVTFDYAREEREWKIEDGTRADVPYSLEELEDAKALMDIDLYKKTYNNLSDYMTQMEDSTVLAWLDEQFDLYDGIEVDPLQWQGFITKRTFDCDSTSITTALPSEYIEKMFKFYIDRLIIDIADKAKLEDMTFVIYGNPRFISLLNPVVNWVTRPGSTANGVKLDYSYGIMTSGDIKVQVVSTKKVNATKEGTGSNTVYSGVRIIPFPLNQEQFTFKHYKYTTHILTSQNSAYRSPDLPGGSMTYLMGVSRYTNAAVQGIQAQMKIANAQQFIAL